MGASGWISRVDYQPDIAAALEIARWDAFRSGHFYRNAEELAHTRTMSDEQFAQWVDDEVGPLNADQIRELWIATRTEPQDPDMLLTAQPYSGTHSVIDMTSVAATPDFSTVAPLSPHAYENVFSTQTPSTEAVAAAAAARSFDLYDRWQGMYVIGYRDGSPETIFFLGFSGD